MRRFALKQNIQSFLAQLAIAKETEQQQQLGRMVDEARQELVGLERLWCISCPDLNIPSAVGRDCELVLDHIVSAAKADYGSLQIWNDKRDCLALIAQTNFDGALIKQFSEVREGDGSVCAEALQLRTHVVLDDLEDDERFPKIHGWAGKVGIKAIVSQPVMNGSGRCIGVFSLHYRRPHIESAGEQLLLHAYEARFRDLLAVMTEG